VAGGCDTHTLLREVNTSGWCGHKDWRIPTVDELSSLVDYERKLPAINKDYFPDIVMPAGFWSATTAATSAGFAWIVVFDDGYMGTCTKSWPYYVRLVRGGK
jgi:hypothetical protein